MVNENRRNSGFGRAAKLSPERRSEISRAAAQKRWSSGFKGRLMSIVENGMFLTVSGLWSDVPEEAAMFLDRGEDIENAVEHPTLRAVRKK